MQHTDSPAAVKYADEKGIYAFGQASDMVQFGPNAHLTAIVDNWNPYYLKRVKAVLDGTWKSGAVWDGIRLPPQASIPTNYCLRLKARLRQLPLYKKEETPFPATLPGERIKPLLSLVSPWAGQRPALRGPKKGLKQGARLRKKFVKYSSATDRRMRQKIWLC